MKRIYLLSMIMVLVLSFFSTGYGNDEKNKTVSISGRILDLQDKPVKDARVILENPIDSKRITSTDEKGTFSFSKILIEKGKNVSLEINATGYSFWKNAINPSEDVFLYINIAPMQDNLVLILLLPAMMGLIAWVSIKLSLKWGKWLSIFMLSLYFITLSIWILSTRNLIRLPSDVAGQTSGLLPYLTYGVALVILALLVIQFDLISRLHDSLISIKIAILGGQSNQKKDAIMERREIQRSSVNCFAATATALWILSLIGLFYGYFLYGTSSISIFQPDFSVPLLVPFFAFLGVLVYSTANIREGAELSEDCFAFRKKLIVLGERILIGPYIALIAYLVLLGPILKSVNMGNSPTTAFLAFFTGLYVKQVMDRLDQIGLSLLTAESQEKIKKREEEKDELVEYLGLTDSLAQSLKNMKITSIEDLANLSEGTIDEKLKNYPTISKAQLYGNHEMARLYKKEMQALRNILLLDSEQIDILRLNQVASIQQLASSSLDSLVKLPDLGDDEETIKNLKSKTEAILKLADICQRIDKDSFDLLKNINIRTFKQLEEEMIKNSDVWEVIEKINTYTPKGREMLYDKIIDAEVIFDPSTETGTSQGTLTHDHGTDMTITKIQKDIFIKINIKKYGDIPLQFIVSYKELTKQDTLYNGKRIADILGGIVILDVFEYFNP